MKNKIFALFLFMMIAVGLASAQNVTLTGTFSGPAPVPAFNGVLQLQLYIPGAVRAISGCGGSSDYYILPVMIQISISAGSLVSPPTIWGADCLTPGGIPYKVVVRDTNGNIVVSDYWLITGPTFDIGQAQSAVPIVPSYNQGQLTYPPAGIPNSTGTGWGTSYGVTGDGSRVMLSNNPSFTGTLSGDNINVTGSLYVQNLISASLAPGCLQVVTGGLVTSTGVDCGSGGGGGGSVSGSGTAGWLSEWTSTSALGLSPIDDEVSTTGFLTAHKALAIDDGTGTNGRFIAYAGTVGSGVLGAAVYGSDGTTGLAMVNENNTGWSEICTGANSSTVTGCGSGSVTTRPAYTQFDGLVGAFADSSGNVIEPIWIGNGPTKWAIPIGATQLQLGVNDDNYSAEGGSWVIAVNGVNHTVAGTTTPWENTGGINPQYPLANTGATSPVVVPVSGVQVVTIQYVSGTVTDAAACGLGSVNVDADGVPDCVQWTGVSGNMPARWAGVVTLDRLEGAKANSTLLGSGASGAGQAYTEITLGAGLSMSGTTLSVSAVSSTFVAETITCTTTCTLSHTPTTFLSLTRNGLEQRLTTDFTRSSATVSLVTAAVGGDTFYAQYYY